MSEERRWNPAACLARIALQDPGASRELVEHYQPLVWKLVRAHRSRSIPDEDLVREVFMKLFSRLDRYEPRDGIPFEHWLSRLAVRTCLDALRTERRRPQPADPPLSEAAGEWLETLQRDDKSARLLRGHDDALRSTVASSHGVGATSA